MKRLFFIMPISIFFMLFSCHYTSQDKKDTIKKGEQTFIASSDINKQSINLNDLNEEIAGLNIILIPYLITMF